MNESDRKFIGLAFAWMVAVAFVAQRGTEGVLSHAQVTQFGHIEAMLDEPVEEIDAPTVAEQPAEQLPNSRTAERQGSMPVETYGENIVAQPNGQPVAERLPNAPEPPLEIRISGPVDSLVGDLVELHAETTQEVASFAWSISPPVRGLMILDDGEKAVFANRHAGEYLVIVSTANAAGQSAHATMPFTIRPAPPENPLTAQSLGQANPPPDLRDLIRRWAAEVITDNRTGEAAAVAASLRQVGNLLASGQLAQTPGADPLFEVERAAETSMGPAAFQRWGSFFIRVRDFLQPLNETGYVREPIQFANAFNNLAGELEQIAAGR